MKKIISRCPCCDGDLHIATLQCPDCGVELKNAFEISAFEKLSDEQYRFLVTFLQHRGNLKNAQADLGISYPTAKKKLDDLLNDLGLSVQDETSEEEEELDMSNYTVDYTSNKASEIIKAKLLENGGHVTVYTARGLPCEIWAGNDGTSFISDKLPIKPAYSYHVFDVIVDLLVAQGGRARKGNGRNYKLGEPACDKTTVVGVVAMERGNKPGDSVFDPVFVMAAVLEWAGIAHNERGELVLTHQYRSML